MDVEFDQGLCNCQPIKIPEYGKYILEKPLKLIDGIPKLPDILFNMICNPQPQAPTVSTPKAQYDNNMVRQLCECISINHWDNYSAWIQLGMTWKTHYSTVGAMVRLEQEQQRVRT